ncbi:RNA polymerase sigma factor [bacterium]|nr:RNA polymerase sigma factor [bacterium]
MNERDFELIQSAKAGDNRAFDELIRLYDKRILHIAYGIMGNMQDAYDAYQDGVIRAYRKLPSFRFESSFSTWLTRIVINQALNMKKKRRLKQFLSFAQPEMLPSEAFESGLPGPDEVYVNGELSAELERGMQTLSDRERTVFVLKHQHGYKLREIAVMIDCAEGTVKNYLFRATRKLRDELADSEPTYKTQAAAN